jgi:hypothetical protein
MGYTWDGDICCAEDGSEADTAGVLGAGLYDLHFSSLKCAVEGCISGVGIEFGMSMSTRCPRAMVG